MIVLIEEYDNFIKMLNIIFKDTKIDDTDEYLSTELDKLLALSDSEKNIKCNNFVNSLSSDELFEGFIESKTKTFSHKSNETKELSMSLLDIPLKNLLNNQSDKIKDNIWRHLYKIYLATVMEKPVEEQDENRINKILELLNSYEKPTDSTRSKIKSIFNMENETNTTTLLIDDVIDSFETILEDKQANPISKIAELTSQIADKYSGSLKNGDIPVDKLLNHIMESLPKGIAPMVNSLMTNMTGTEEPNQIIMDENFSTEQIKVGSNVSSKSSSGLGNKLFSFLSQSQNTTNGKDHKN
jgi:hypothetical protein